MVGVIINMYMHIAILIMMAVFAYDFPILDSNCFVPIWLFHMANIIAKDNVSNNDAIPLNMMYKVRKNINAKTALIGVDIIHLLNVS